MVTLYQGGQYHLYRYKRYTDVRLVFAPEQQIAFYGGDPDNFAYPRYDLDVCFFRVYENGKPAKIEHYLKWSKDGVKDDELVFVSGHPGHTDRLNTVADLEYQRDVRYPFALQRLNRLEVMLSVYSRRGEENERKAKDMLFGVANSRKAYYCGLAGLQDAAIMAKKKAQEKALREAVAKNPELKDLAGAWDTIAKVQKIRAANAKRYNMLEGRQGFNSSLFGYARTLVRAAEELPKPNEKRLHEFGESGLESLKIKLFSPSRSTTISRSSSSPIRSAGCASSSATTTRSCKRCWPASRPRCAAHELIEGTSCSTSSSARSCTRRASGRQRLGRSDDPAGQAGRSGGPQGPQDSGIGSSGAERAGLRQDRPGQVRRRRDQHLSRRHLHPAAVVRPGQGLRGGRQQDPLRDDIRGPVREGRAEKNRRRSICRKRWIDRKDKLNLKTPFNFVCTGRHHRRQLRQPGRQPERRSGRPDLRRQHPVAGLGFRLHRGAGPRRGRSARRRFPKRCGQSTTPIRWRMS